MLIIDISEILKVVVHRHSIYIELFWLPLWRCII